MVEAELSACDNLKSRELLNLSPSLNAMVVLHIGSDWNIFVDGSGDMGNAQVCNAWVFMEAA